MDIKTLLLALALGNLSLCAALFFFEAGARRAGQATHAHATWARAKQCQALAWLLLYLRGDLPDMITIPLANAVLFAGFALDAAALWEQAGRRVWRSYLLPALGAAIGIYSGAWLLQVPAGGRIAIASLAAGFFFVAGAAALGRGWRQGTALRRYVVMLMLVLSVVVVGRGLLSLAPGGVQPLVVQLGMGAVYLMMLGNAFGYLLLAREQEQAELARLEVVDPLTDVPNRRGFYNVLTPWIALARRPGMPTALVILNLDQFKRVNDSYGHTAGDVVLKAMVDVCKKQLRDSDQMGRLGGAEFALLLPRTSLEDASMVAERIRNAVAAQPVKAEKAIINMTASLGVTTIRAEDSTVSLFKRADEALQAAKQAGRNRVMEAEVIKL
ncbi:MULTISPECIES: diguanylate cyclase [unclassified Duganella]|uniref:GGDEF domain-containing protein n=1 Tax=unclassified Duganella TaxID=2636909 RepID=UPI0008823FE8|nr:MULTISPECIES: GGDEF domain-containing protein [unclassified Duganella]SDG36016.1 diguanylate cyclase (GGDEF) domain-containing protein [Duganella sp. OV458]SDJ67426.1 diguanylate cyclase (GGDEF) domain-containing protein [Duganella sp. OV510]